MSVLYLSRLHYPVTALGPGNRIGLWVQGCSIRCPGCISLDTWANGKGATTVGAVQEAIVPWLALADGLTISGGEPLDQASAIEELLHKVRPAFDGDVLLYTGYPTRTALDHTLIRSGLVDAVVPEPYDRTAPQSRSLRGSDNQPLIPLTGLGHDRFRDLIDAPPRRQLDVMFGDRGVWFAGIPGPGEFALLTATLQADGHQVATSEDKRYPTE